MAGTLEARAVGLGTIGAGEEERPLRVLAVTPLPSSRASMIHVTRQVASLEAPGVTCKTFTVASRTTPRLVLSEWRRLRKEIWAFKPDIVHAHYGTMTAFLAILSTALPVIVTYRGSDLNPNRSKGWLRDVVGTLLSQIAALRAARIICVSNQLKNKLWWRRVRVSVIPTGVDITLFHPRDLQEARRELEWGQDERVVLFNAGDPIIKRLDLARAGVEFAESLCGKIRFAALDGDVPVGDVRERLERVRPSVIVPRDACAIGKAIFEILKQGQRSNGRESVTDLSSKVVSQRIVTVYRTLQNEYLKSGSRFWTRPGHRSFPKRSRVMQ